MELQESSFLSCSRGGPTVQLSSAQSMHLVTGPDTARAQPAGEQLSTPQLAANDASRREQGR